MRGFNNSTPGQDGRREVVRYDSPKFEGFLSGFSVAAAWGEDDVWDAALTYKGSWNGISVLAKAGYGASNDIGSTSIAGENNTQSGTVCGGNQPGKTSSGVPLITDYACTWEGAAATIKHDPTGLYLYGGWGKQKFTDFFSQTPPAAPALQNVWDPTSTTWFIQPGIERNWFDHLGTTTIFGMYRHDNAGTNPGTSFGAELTFWQGGVVQHIDAAAMDLYAIYQQTDGDAFFVPSFQTAPSLAKRLSTPSRWSPLAL